MCWLVVIFGKVMSCMLIKGDIWYIELINVLINSDNFI